MNILISTESNLVIAYSDQPIYQEVDQWATNGAKMGIGVDSALMESDVIPPDNFTLNAFTYEGGTWTVVNQEAYDEQVQANTDAEASAKRIGRDERLVATDWTQAGDLPMSFRTPWATYRQELRDMPQAAGWPWNPYPPIPNIAPPSAAPNEGVTEA